MKQSRNSDTLLGNRKVIAIGGAYLSFKFILLNAISGYPVLDNLLPIPIYVISGEKYELIGIDKTGVDIHIESDNLLKTICEYEDLDTSVIDRTLRPRINGKEIDRFILTSPKMKYNNIAFLDTSVYPRPDVEGTIKKSYEEQSREQLNASDHIIWAIKFGGLDYFHNKQISDEEIKFIRTLDESVPITFIVPGMNSEDKARRYNDRLREELNFYGIKYTDVITLDSVDKVKYEHFFDIERQRLEKMFME